jgi:hypothetical protein
VIFHFPGTNGSESFFAVFYLIKNGSIEAHFGWVTERLAENRKLD